MTMSKRTASQWAQNASFWIGVCAGGTFLIEDVRGDVETHVGPPNDPREWGVATKLAEREGTIRKVGYAKTRSSNGSPKVLWSAA
jgi:hypothetical protein